MLTSMDDCIHCTTFPCKLLHHLHSTLTFKTSVNAQLSGKIPRPMVQTKVAKSDFDSKKLPRAKKLRKHVLPVFPEHFEEITVMWKVELYNEKHLIMGSSLLDCEGMDSRYLPMFVASHLQTKAPLPSSAISLLSQDGLLSVQFLELTLSARALNASSTLMALKAPLQNLNASSSLSFSPQLFYTIQYNFICIVSITMQVFSRHFI